MQRPRSRREPAIFDGDGARRTDRFECPCRQLGAGVLFDDDGAAEAGSVAVRAARVAGGHDAVAQAPRDPGHQPATPAIESPKLASMKAKSVRMSFGKAAGKRARLWKEADRGFDSARRAPRRPRRGRGPRPGAPPPTRGLPHSPPERRRSSGVLNRRLELVDALADEVERRPDLLEAHLLAGQRVAVDPILGQAVPERRRSRRRDATTRTSSIWPEPRPTGPRARVGRGERHGEHPGPSQPVEERRRRHQQL